MLCLKCLNDEDAKLEDCRFYFAKYYPSTGWYLVGENEEERAVTGFTEFFEKHKHETLYGDYLTVMSESLMPKDSLEGQKRGVFEAVLGAAKIGKAGH
jgi:hypothetical protein